MKGQFMLPLDEGMKLHCLSGNFLQHSKQHSNTDKLLVLSKSCLYICFHNRQNQLSVLVRKDVKTVAVAAHAEGQYMYITTDYWS